VGRTDETEVRDGYGEVLSATGTRSSAAGRRGARIPIRGGVLGPRHVDCVRLRTRYAEFARSRRPMRCGAASSWFGGAAVSRRVAAPVVLPELVVVVGLGCQVRSCLRAPHVSLVRSTRA
jgi:hypothetical protein